MPVWLGAALTGLHVEDGRVTGREATRDGRPVLVRARRGVLIATGGFERNEAMRQRYQRAPVGTEWTTGSAGNTGDGIIAGEAAGAALDLMDDAWWGPSIPLSGGPYFCLAERSLPGCILVNGAGQRFVNESAPYVDAVHAMYDAHSPGNPHIPALAGVRSALPQQLRVRRDAAAQAAAAPVVPGGRGVPGAGPGRPGRQIGVDAGALAKTVARFNEFAEAGQDEDFGRGASAYDRYYGDPRCRPNPNLAPLDQPPFYAAKIVPGDLGTKGGLRTDERARVLRPDGTAIPGLYAAGNASASVMGHSYAGAGATIGPAMTFGYLAALDMARRWLTPDPGYGRRTEAVRTCGVSAVATAMNATRAGTTPSASRQRGGRGKCADERRAADESEPAESGDGDDRGAWARPRQPGRRRRPSGRSGPGRSRGRRTRRSRRRRCRRAARR